MLKKGIKMSAPGKDQRQGDGEYSAGRKKNFGIELLIYAIAFLFVLEDSLLDRINTIATMVLAGFAWYIGYRDYRAKLIERRQKQIQEKILIIVGNILNKARLDQSGSVHLDSIGKGCEVKTVAGVKYYVEWQLIRRTFPTELRQFIFSFRRLNDQSAGDGSEYFRTVKYSHDGDTLVVGLCRGKTLALPENERSEVELEFDHFSDEEWDALIILMYYILQDGWWKN